MRLIPLASLCFAGLCAGTAGAQSVNYGQLEELFDEPVTTSVTGTPYRVSQVPATMEIITAEEIRRSGARDIPGVLRHVAGVDMLQWGNDNADASLRGYNQAGSPRTLVLIDGRQVYADFFGLTPWPALPVELLAIRQIEIVKGPNSALFGFNAIGGVINIVTWHPYHDDVNAVSATAGTQGLLQGSLVTSTRVGEHGGIRMIAGGNSNDDFSTPQDPLDLGSRRGNERIALNLQGYWAFAEDRELTLEYTHSQASQPDHVAVNSAIFERYISESMQAVFATDTRAGLIQARLYSNELQVLNGTPTGDVLLHNRVTVAQVQDLFKPGLNHTVRLAAEYRFNSMDTMPVTGGKVLYDVLALSAMWDWQILPQLAIVNAVRADHQRKGRRGSIPPGLGYTNADWDGEEATELSFNSGLVWTPTDQDTLRLSVARGVQAPNLFEMGGGLYAVPTPGPTLYATGSPFIEATIGTQYELAWDRKLPGIGGGLRFAAFYGVNNDFATLAGGVPPSFLVISTSANVGDSQIIGLEIALKGKSDDGWNWGLSYTPRWVKDDFLPGFGISYGQIDFAHTTPKHIVNAQAGWARGRWELDAFLRYQSHVVGIRGDGAPLNGTVVPIHAYGSVDARVGYSVSKRVTLALSGQNLLESEQKQTASAAVERRVLGTLSVDF